MQDRGLAAYITELVGTFFLVLMICGVVSLYLAAGGDPQFGSDFAVIGLVQGLTLFALVMALGGVSGAHLNPAVTTAALLLKRIAAIDAVVYILAQLSGGVLGALLVKGLLLDEGRAANYGAAQVSDLLGGNFAGAVVEGLGAFLIVLGVVAVALNKGNWREWGALSIGLAFAAAVMVFGPLTGGSFNPARWFGPALVSGEWGGVWPYIVGPLVGGTLAALFYKYVISPGESEEDGAEKGEKEKAPAKEKAAAT